MLLKKSKRRAHKITSTCLIQHINLQNATHLLTPHPYIISLKAYVQLLSKFIFSQLSFVLNVTDGVSSNSTHTPQIKSFFP